MNGSNYKGIIWTNHALERLRERKLPQQTAWLTFTQPDEKLKGKEKNTIEYRKKIGSSTVTVIATQNEKKQWIILSCWVDPPLPGSIDIQKKKAYQEYKRAGFWKRIWLQVRQLLFNF